MTIKSWQSINHFVVETILSTTSSILKSLESIESIGIVDGSICYVKDIDENYRWDQTSTAIPNGSTVVLPTDRSLVYPGRWLLIVVGGSGEVNTATNVGTGIGIYRNKTTTILNLRTLKSTNNALTVALSGSGNEVDLTFVTLENDGQHGNLGGGSLHATVTNALAGFVPPVFYYLMEQVQAGNL